MVSPPLLLPTPLLQPTLPTIVNVMQQAELHQPTTESKLATSA
jgi:hypothetical protein